MLGFYIQFSKSLIRAYLPVLPITSGFTSIGVPSPRLLPLHSGINLTLCRISDINYNLGFFPALVVVVGLYAVFKEPFVFVFVFV